MKTGEITYSAGTLDMPRGFYMMLGGQMRPITLRCTTDGTVQVEEVAGGSMPLRTLNINMMQAPMPSQPSINDAHITSTKTGQVRYE